MTPSDSGREHGVSKDGTGWRFAPGDRQWHCYKEGVPDSLCGKYRLNWRGATAPMNGLHRNTLCPECAEAWKTERRQTGVPAVEDARRLDDYALAKGAVGILELRTYARKAIGYKRECAAMSELLQSPFSYGVSVCRYGNRRNGFVGTVDQAAAKVKARKDMTKQLTLSACGLKPANARVGEAGLVDEMSLSDGEPPTRGAGPAGNHGAQGEAPVNTTGKVPDLVENQSEAFV